MVGFQPPEMQTRSQAIVSGLPSSTIAGPVQGPDLDRAHPPLPMGRGDRMAGHHANAGRLGLVRESAVELRAQVDHRDHDAGAVQIERGSVGGVVVREHDGVAARADRVAVQVAARRARQHDARTVVLGEYQRPLDRAGREHGLPGARLPQALAGQARGRRRS